MYECINIDICHILRNRPDGEKWMWFQESRTSKYPKKVLTGVLSWHTWGTTGAMVPSLDPNAAITTEWYPAMMLQGFQSCDRGNPFPLSSPLDAAVTTDYIIWGVKRSELEISPIPADDDGCQLYNTAGTHHICTWLTKWCSCLNVAELNCTILHLMILFTPPEPHPKTVLLHISLNWRLSLYWI